MAKYLVGEFVGIAGLGDTRTHDTIRQVAEDVVAHEDRAYEIQAINKRAEEEARKHKRVAPTALGVTGLHISALDSDGKPCTLDPVEKQLIKAEIEVLKSARAAPAKPGR